jgi:hypothetical protein
MAPRYMKHYGADEARANLPIGTMFAIRSTLALFKLQSTLCPLIGIDPDYRVHVAERLLAQNDGPLLEGMKRLKGILIRVPEDVRFQPDRDRLAMRFSEFDPAR